MSNRTFAYFVSVGVFLAMWQYSVLDNVYEMWGQYAFSRGYPTVIYPILRAIVPPFLLHLGLALGGVWLFFRTFDVGDSKWWAFLVLPYVGFCTVQFTSALPPFIVLAILYWMRR